MQKFDICDFENATACGKICDKQIFGKIGDIRYDRKNRFV